ncbi:MAG TPA: DUF1269 domain-containing protein [Solirubrobacteraceae bacterium]|jgi:uncharacterized membrane protein
MSDLIAIAYPDRYTAEAVRETLSDLVAQRSIELEDAVVVTRDEEGKVKLHQAVQPAAKGAAGGILAGGLIGLLFLAPIIGMAIGAAAGGVAGAFTDAGIDDSFMKKLGANLAPGGAALIVLVRKVTPDRVLPHVQRYGGEVIQTSLDDETEARLREALAPEAAAAAGAPA